MLPLSVVICTYNRAPYLKIALQSLIEQTLPVDSYDITVIDDGSNDQTSEIVESFKSILPVRYLFQENRGLAAAKNRGLEESQGKIIFFFDDDDAASPDLLEQHLFIHQRHPQNHYAVLNYTTWAPQLFVTCFMRFITEVGRHLFNYPTTKGRKIVDYTYFWGGRTSCKRDFLRNNGRFNPVFRFGCEDIELGYRLSKHGLKVVYNSKAISYMTRAVTLFEFLNRLQKQGQSQAMFSKMHPVDEVRKWCEIDSINEEWRQMKPVYDIAVKSSLELERIINLKARMEIKIDPLTERLFYQALWNVLRAAKVKGMIDGSQSKESLS